ncbi:MAG: hypothetical protein ACYCUF_01635 [Acidimicrobiales bacterium]|nr:hypothetical protein [Actinomycetota bacterium]MDA8183749.1 hypothetical protein [Actinomycetota bacterium]
MNLHEERTRDRNLRIVGIGGLVGMAVVHLNLYWREDYRLIPTIGWLFLLTVLSALVLAVAMALHPARLVALGSALFALGTLASYAVALTRPLFGFEEPGISYSGGVAIASEVLAALALGAWAWKARRP